MSDVRQSPEYAQFIKSLNWQVEKIDNSYAFIKKFPLIGSLIKIQRIKSPIPFEKIESLAKKYRAFQVIIEPALPLSTQFPKAYHPLKSPFIPTKTLIKDIRDSEEEIYASFSKNKRRDIRIAEKNGILTKEGTIEDFFQLKKQYLLKKFILPIGTRKEIKLICEAFGSKAKILVAEDKGKVIAGALLLFHGKTAYYWQAAATDKGKKLLAPTLVIWEAIKFAKKNHCEFFDFEGVFDERFPENKSWEGFTHFKEGFRGEEVIYPLPLSKTRLHIVI